MKVNQTYKPYDLMGPAVTRLVQEPLATNTSDNRLYVLESIMFLNISIQEKGPLQGCEELEVFYGLLGALKQ